MKPVSPTFNEAAGPVLEEQLRLQGWIILYWILWIDLDDRRKKEHRRVRKAQQKQHRQERASRPAPAFRPRPPAGTCPRP